MNWNLDSVTGASTATTANHLVTTADLVAYKALTASVISFMTDVIGYVSTEFESYIKFPIALQKFIGYPSKEAFDGSFLYLWNNPIVSVDSIKYRSSDTSEYNNDITNSVEIDKAGNYRLYYPNNIFPCGQNSVQVIYNAGYSTIPGDIKKIAIEACIWCYKESNNYQADGLLGISSKNSGGGANTSINFLDLNPRWKGTLDYYKRIGSR